MLRSGNIVQLKNIPEGDSVSYERSFIAGRPSTIATLGFGYADGIPRPWSKVGRAIVNGQYAPFAGHICMDQCMLDVTDIPNVKLGDEVTIIGKSGGLEVRAEDLADALGTIGTTSRATAIPIADIYIEYVAPHRCGCHKSTLEKPARLRDRLFVSNLYRATSSFSFWSDSSPRLLRPPLQLRASPCSS